MSETIKSIENALFDAHSPLRDIYSENKAHTCSENKGHITRVKIHLIKNKEKDKAKTTLNTSKLEEISLSFPFSFVYAYFNVCNIRLILATYAT